MPHLKSIFEAQPFDRRWLSALRNWGSTSKASRLTLSTSTIRTCTSMGEVSLGTTRRSHSTTRMYPSILETSENSSLQTEIWSRHSTAPGNTSGLAQSDGTSYATLEKIMQQPCTRGDWCRPRLPCDRSKTRW